MYKNMKKSLVGLAFSFLGLLQVGCGPSIGVEGYYPLGSPYYRDNSGYYWGMPGYYPYNNSYYRGYHDGYFWGPSERYYHDEDYSRGGFHDRR